MGAVVSGATLAHTPFSVAAAAPTYTLALAATFLDSEGSVGLDKACAWAFAHNLLGSEGSTGLDYHEDAGALATFGLEEFLGSGFGQPQPSTEAHSAFELLFTQPTYVSGCSIGFSQR